MQLNLCGKSLIYASNPQKERVIGILQRKKPLSNLTDRVKTAVSISLRAVFCLFDRSYALVHNYFLVIFHPRMILLF